MRVFSAIAIVALLAGPAYAQTKSVPKYGDLEGKSPKEIAEEKEAEKAYKRSLGNIPEKTSPVDPWGNARSADAPRSEPKAIKTAAPKPKTKTGEAAK